MITITNSLAARLLLDSSRRACLFFAPSRGS